MNIYRLSVAGVNVAEGLKRFNGNNAMYEKFILKFVDDKNFDEMCRSLDDRDAGAAFAAAHTLKGLAGNLSFTKLREDIDPLVEQLRKGSLDETGKMLEPVKRDYADLIRMINGN